MAFLFVFLQVVVVQAISALCQKYPRKHGVMMTFLSNMLRDDVGGLVCNHRICFLKFLLFPLNVIVFKAACVSQIVCLLLLADLSLLNMLLL